MAIRKKVVWSTPQAGQVELSDGSFHAGPNTIDAPFVADLELGDLLYVKASTGLSEYKTYDSKKRPPPYPLISGGGYHGDVSAPVGTLAIYLGTTRTNEIPNGKFAKANRVLRHLVGIDGKKYIVLNWNDFAPVGA
jgi:hypothetical protein